MRLDFTLVRYVWGIRPRNRRRFITALTEMLLPVLAYLLLIWTGYALWSREFSRVISSLGISPSIQDVWTKIFNCISWIELYAYFAVIFLSIIHAIQTRRVHQMQQNWRDYKLAGIGPLNMLFSLASPYFAGLAIFSVLHLTFYVFWMVADANAPPGTTVNIINPRLSILFVLFGLWGAALIDISLSTLKRIHRHRLLYILLFLLASPLAWIKPSLLFWTPLHVLTPWLPLLVWSEVFVFWPIKSYLIWKVLCKALRTLEGEGMDSAGA